LSFEQENKKNTKNNDLTITITVGNLTVDYNENKTIVKRQENITIPSIQIIQNNIQVLN